MYPNYHGWFHTDCATTEDESESFKSQTCKAKVKAFPECHSYVYSQSKGTDNGLSREYGKNGNVEHGTVVNLCCMMSCPHRN